MTLTREETIERLKQNKAAAEYYAGQSRITAEIENALKDSEAFEMAIEALANLKEEFKSADAVQGEWIEKYNGNGWNDFWDYTCSHCGKKYERADAVLYHANYCPNCGAKMKGGDLE